jgi:hypothetical protein
VPIVSEPFSVPSLRPFDLVLVELHACRIALQRACSPLAVRFDVAFSAFDAVIVEADDEGLCIATVELDEPDRRGLVQALKALLVDLKIDEQDPAATEVDGLLVADVVARLGGWDLS